MPLGDQTKEWGLGVGVLPPGEFRELAEVQQRSVQEQLEAAPLFNSDDASARRRTMLVLCSRALRVGTPPTPVVMMPRTVVMMSGTSREHEKRLLRGVMVEALEVQQRKRTALQEQLERTEAAPLFNSDDEKAAKAHAKALRREAQVPARLSEVDAAETLLAELQAKLRSGGDVVEVRGRGQYRH